MKYIGYKLLVHTTQTVTTLLFVVVIINYCEGDPCENGGTCFNKETTFGCICGKTADVTFGGPTCAQGSFQLVHVRNLQV